MVVIRLARGGAKKRPFYNIVVTDSRRRRDSGYIERIGYFNPRAQTTETRFEIDRERLDYWRGQGGQLSDRVTSLVKSGGARKPKKKPAKPANSAEPAKPETPAASAAPEQAASPDADPGQARRARSICRAESVCKIRRPGQTKGIRQAEGIRETGSPGQTRDIRQAESIRGNHETGTPRNSGLFQTLITPPARLPARRANAHGTERKVRQRCH